MTFSRQLFLIFVDNHDMGLFVSLGAVSTVSLGSSWNGQREGPVPSPTSSSAAWLLGGSISVSRITSDSYEPDVSFAARGVTAHYGSNPISPLFRLAGKYLPGIKVFKVDVQTEIRRRFHSSVPADIDWVESFFQRASAQERLLVVQLYLGEERYRTFPPQEYDIAFRINRWISRAGLPREFGMNFFESGDEVHILLFLGLSTLAAVPKAFYESHEGVRSSQGHHTHPSNVPGAILPSASERRICAPGGGDVDILLKFLDEAVCLHPECRMDIAYTMQHRDGGSIYVARVNSRGERVVDIYTAINGTPDLTRYWDELKTIRSRLEDYDLPISVRFFRVPLEWIEERRCPPYSRTDFELNPVTVWRLTSGEGSAVVKPDLFVCQKWSDGDWDLMEKVSFRDTTESCNSASTARREVSSIVNEAIAGPAIVTISPRTNSFNTLQDSLDLGIRFQLMIADKLGFDHRQRVVDRLARSLSEDQKVQVVSYLLNHWRGYNHVASFLTALIDKIPPQRFMDLLPQVINLLENENAHIQSEALRELRLWKFRLPQEGVVLLSLYFMNHPEKGVDVLLDFFNRITHETDRVRVLLKFLCTCAKDSLSPRILQAMGAMSRLFSPDVLYEMADCSDPQLRVFAGYALTGLPFDLPEMWRGYLAATDRRSFVTKARCRLENGFLNPSSI